MLPSAGSDTFADLPTPLLEHILSKAFAAGGRDMATRAQLSCVCRCALMDPRSMHALLCQPQFPLPRRAASSSINAQVLALFTRPAKHCSVGHEPLTASSGAGFPFGHCVASLLSCLSAASYHCLRAAFVLPCNLAHGHLTGPWLVLQRVARNRRRVAGGAPSACTTHRCAEDLAGDVAGGISKIMDFR